MSDNNVSNVVMNQISQQELQHLITVSTGFIDAYIVECYGKEPMLVPQNIVLSALDSSTQVDHVEWHDQELPVHLINDPEYNMGVALVIEGDEARQRFALLCNKMPETIRLRISEVVDEHRDETDPSVFQYVRVANQIFHIPNLSYIQDSLGL